MENVKRSDTICVENVGGPFRIPKIYGQLFSVSLIFLGNWPNRLSDVSNVGWPIWPYLFRDHKNRWRKIVRIILSVSQVNFRDWLDSTQMAREIKVKCYLSTQSNEGIEIRRFVYKDDKDPSLKQLKDCARNLFHQLRGEHFELMYIGKIRCF